MGFRIANQLRTKSSQSIGDISSCLNREKIVTNDHTQFFDKNTGEKFAIKSSLRLNGISHYHMKSEISGKTLLLSEYVIQRRFLGGPNQR